MQKHVLYLDKSDKRDFAVDSPGLPSYLHYGQAEAGNDVEPVHCQPIFSRISEQDWEIRPHRHSSLHQLFLIREGSLDAVLEQDRLKLIGPAVLSVPTGRVHGFHYDEGAQGTMISVSEGFLRGVLAPPRSVAGRRSIDEIEIVDLAGLAREQQRIYALFADVASEVAQRKPGFLAALAALLQLLHIELERLDERASLPVAAAEGTRFFERFRDLVVRQMRSHASVSDYCRQLGIGERRLNRICRAAVGVSPLNYIHRQLVEEAKRCLVHTAMPISSIGYDLGFEDSAYFSRFFKKHTGVSPSAYAARHRG